MVMIDGNDTFFESTLCCTIFCSLSYLPYAVQKVPFIQLFLMVKGYKLYTTLNFSQFNIVFHFKHLCFFSVFHNHGYAKH